MAFDGTHIFVLFMTIQLFLPTPLKVELKPKIQLRIRKKKILPSGLRCQYLHRQQRIPHAWMPLAWMPSGRFGGYPLQEENRVPQDLSEVHHAEMG